MQHRFADYCLCPGCRSDLRESEGALQCTTCETVYEIREGMPIFLPDYQDEKRRRYFDSYQKLAKDDLRVPLEEDRSSRHLVLMDFIGNVRNKKVLDIGSSQALYLRHLDAGLKVAFDIGRPYLAAIPKQENIVRVCGDAESLPFKSGFFDVIVVSDLLEHLLEPKNLIDCLRSICSRDTRLIVHIPWYENLEPYAESKYEFTHLRTFNAHSFAHLWQGFYVKRTRGTYPTIDEPIVFKLEGKLPRRLYNILVFIFFETNMSGWEYRRRSRWIKELPQRERWLLYFYKPKFRVFELRSCKRTVYSLIYRALKVIKNLSGGARKTTNGLPVETSRVRENERSRVCQI